LSAVSEQLEIFSEQKDTFTSALESSKSWTPMKKEKLKIIHQHCHMIEIYKFGWLKYLDLSNLCDQPE
jgi:hypothetical protein